MEMLKDDDLYTARYNDGPAAGTTDVWSATSGAPKQHVGVQVGLKTAWYAYTGLSSGLPSHMKYGYRYEFTE